MEGLRGGEVVGCGMGGLRFRLVVCEATREAVEQDLARHEGRLLGLGWLSAYAFTSGSVVRLLRAHGRAQIVIHVILLYLSLASLV